MSKALDYLMQARPEAMGAYFSFLKDAGSRLDPKTRALISVITKVAVQTDKGLLQYTRKALAAGVTPEEILDALLMAFPALGLSRIVWAIDILIDAGVEGFDESSRVATGESAIDCCALEDLPNRQITKRGEIGRAMLLYRNDATVRAFKGYCSHQGMELMPSGIRGDTITCAQHGWRFELPEGRCSRGERWGLAELPVTIVSGRVVVDWSE